MSKIFYLCNGKKKDCKKIDCYTKGGKCKHTSDVKFARNFTKRNRNEKAAYWENEAAPHCETVSKD